MKGLEKLVCSSDFIFILMNVFKDNQDHYQSFELKMDPVYLSKINFEDDVFLIQKIFNQEKNDYDFSLVVWNQDNVFHWPISTQRKESCSLSDLDFPSLSDLITFYQENVLPFPSCCKLGKPLRKNDLFKLYQWYLPNLTESMAIQ